MLAPPQSLQLLLWRFCPAVLALAPAAVMLADARTPAVLAPDPLAVMLADAGAPAALAEKPVQASWPRTLRSWTQLEEGKEVRGKEPLWSLR